MIVPARTVECGFEIGLRHLKELGKFLMVQNAGGTAAAFALPVKAGRVQRSDDGFPGHYCIFIQ
jgi:hypothetical protein